MLSVQITQYLFPDQPNPEPFVRMIADLQSIGSNNKHDYRCILGNQHEQRTIEQASTYCIIVVMQTNTKQGVPFLYTARFDDRDYCISQTDIETDHSYYNMLLSD